MDIEILKRFFLWCLVVNTGVYAFTAIAARMMRGFIARVHESLFGYDEATTLRSVQRYLADYKLLITVFNFTPWVALLIIAP